MSKEYRTFEEVAWQEGYTRGYADGEEGYAFDLIMPNSHKHADAELSAILGQFEALAGELVTLRNSCPTDGRFGDAQRLGLGVSIDRLTALIASVKKERGLL